MPTKKAPAEASARVESQYSAPEVYCKIPLTRLRGQMLSAKCQVLVFLPCRNQRMCNRVHRQRNPVLHPDFTHQLGDVGLHRALFNAQGGPNFFVRTPGDQHLENFLLAVGEVDSTVREDASRGRAYSLDEHRKHVAGGPDRSLIYHSDG